MTAGAAFDVESYFGKIGYTPHPGQLRIHQNPSRFRVVSNGRRWGKTIFGGHDFETTAFLASPMTGEPQKGWVVGPQYDDTEKEFRVMYDSLRKQGVDRDAIKWQNNRDSGAFHMKTSWGWEVVGKSAAHPETLVGEGLDWVLMVEAGRHKRRTWGQYIRPTLSDRRGRALFTGVPEGRSEHSLLFALWQRGQDPTKRQWWSTRSPSWENTIVFPGGRQDPEIFEAEDDLTKDEFNRQYGAEFVDKVGAVFGDFDDEVHVTDVPYRRDLPLYGAVDYGFTNDFVWLWIQLDEFGQVRVIGERRWKRKRTEEIAVDLLATQGALVRSCAAFYPDPAEPDRTMTLEAMLHTPSRGNTGGPLNTRLELIGASLKLRPEHLPDGHPEKVPGLVIDRSCTMLAWEMREGYRWPEHRSEIRSESETPLDKDNHGSEALGRFYKGYFDVVGHAARSRVSKARVG